MITIYFLLSIQHALPIDDVQGDLIIFNTNGGWCWFQDERAIVDKGHLIMGTAASPSGNIDVTVYDLESGKTKVITLHEGLESDDHDSPALLVLPDGRYLAVYSKHHSDSLLRWRISTKAGDATDWQPEQTHELDAPTTYSNLFCMQNENNRIYNFHRCLGWDPNFMIYDMEGNKWNDGGHLLENANDPQNRMRPYLKYASDNQEKIHFITTEAHPHEYEGTSIYHGYLQNGKVSRSDGALVNDLHEGPADPTTLTKIFEGDAQNEAWTIDLHLDSSGHPYLVYSVHKTNEDHRYRYARWDGQEWHDYEMAYAGTCLYPAEAHYTGLAALDPHDPNIVFISTDANPATGQLLISQSDNQRHYEIFQGVTSDNGKTWVWTTITQNSTADNLRPMVPIGDKEDRVLLWLRGTYRTYTDYDLDVVGVIGRR